MESTPGWTRFRPGPHLLAGTKEHSMAGRKTYRRKSGGKKQTPAEKIYKYMMELKDEVLERNVLPWDSGRVGYMAYNPFSGHQYSGLHNTLMLDIDQFLRQRTDARYVTRKKAVEIGADFKGAKMTHLWLPLPRREKNEDTGEEETVGVWFKSFFVFSVEDFNNLDELKIPAKPVYSWGDTPVAERIEAVSEHLLANFKRKPLIKEEARIRAPYYQPRTHEIGLPPTSQYMQPERYVQSKIHELVHATGASSELDRFKADKFGEPCSPSGGDYAFEEMVTQFATAYLLKQYGFAHERKTSAAYILSWYKSIEDKPELLGNSIQMAMSVVRFINNANPLPQTLLEDISDDEDDEVLELAA